MRGARSSIRFAVWFAALVTLSVSVASFGQEIPPNNQTPPDSATIDSLLALADSLTPRYLFTPVYRNKVDADVSKVGMLNEFKTAFNTPWGSRFNFSLSHEEKNYRLTPQFEETKLMQLSDLHMFNLFWQGTASYSDTRVLNRSRALGGGFTDFVINDKTGTLGSTYRRDYGPLRTDLIGSGGVISSERTFKEDEGIQSGVNGGVAYSLGNRVILRGRGAVRREWNRSTTIDSLFTGLGSNEDSVSTGARFQVTDSIAFNANYSRYNGDRTFTDQGRGSLGGQQGGAENVFEENERRNTRNTTLTLNSRFGRRFSLLLTGKHDERVLDYREQSTRDSRTVGDAATGAIGYTMPWRATASVQFETGRTLNDFGPLSTASFNEEKQRVAVTLHQALSKTFSVDLSGSSQLTQSFYIKYEDNPRDRDQVDTNLKLRITSAPFNRVSADIGIGYSNTEVVNIDSLQSSDNRVEELWELRPSFTVHVTPRFAISQTYGLSFEYTDYTFDEDQNLLDRNINFTNTFFYSPMTKVDLLFEYALFLHDNGSYLPDPVTGVRYYEKASEDRRDRSRIRVDYNVLYRKVDTRLGSMSFFAEHLYSRLEGWIPGDFENRTTTTDGQIQVGSEANYDWGGGKILRFYVARVKKFSDFGSDKEKNYWDARSEIAYPF